MTSAASAMLLVEDNPRDVLLLQRALRKANVAGPIQVVGDGEQALAYLAGQDQYADREAYPLPGLLLLDLKLPRRDGFEVLAWLRQHPGLRRLPVVVFTSSGDSSDIARAYDLGANSYVVKPIGLPDLERLAALLAPYWLGVNELPPIL